MGDSIHGSDYYWPFEEFFEGRHTEKTKCVGAVCGGLSYYGAYAAIANGVPALTMGEPGHCAYTVRVNPKDWVPGYTLSWQRGCHWSMWPGYGTWASLILMQKLFEDQEKTNASFDWATLADFAKAQKDGVKSEKVVELYEKALKVQPLNFPVWIDYLNYLKQTEPISSKVWQKANQDVCATFGATYPEMAWMLLTQIVYPQLMPLLKDAKEKTEAMEVFIASTDKMEPCRWNVEGAFDEQLKQLGSDSDRTKMAYLDMILKHLMTKDAYAPIVLAWGQGQTKDKEALAKEFTEKSIASLNNDKIGGDALLSLCSQAILGAEANKDLSTFQAIGKIVKDKMGVTLPEYEKFPGELLSSGGMIIPSATCGYDVPYKHWGVLEECGGFFHTPSMENATVLVELPKMSDINGVVLVLWPNFVGRCGNMIIEVSEDGQTWKKVHQFEGAQHVQRADLQASPQRGRFIRITRPGGDFFHLNAIHVYGKRAS